MKLLGQAAPLALYRLRHSLTYQLAHVHCSQQLRSTHAVAKCNNRLHIACALQPQHRPRVVSLPHGHSACAPQQVHACQLHGGDCTAGPQQRVCACKGCAKGLINPTQCLRWHQSRWVTLQLAPKMCLEGKFLTRVLSLTNVPGC